MQNPAYWLGGPPGPTETITDIVDAIRTTSPLGKAQGDKQSGEATQAKHGIEKREP